MLKKIKLWLFYTKCHDCGLLFKRSELIITSTWITGKRIYVCRGCTGKGKKLWD